MSDPRKSTNWHHNVYFGLHYDLHAGLTDTELGATLTHDNLRQELARVRPDFIQCDCKGHAGYTSWPTEVGTPSPGIVHDALRIHRDVTAELGIPLVMHYSGVWDNRAIELHPDWARVGPPGEVAGKEGFVTGATCNLSAYTDELMIPQMLELIDKYDVDGFWVDGENWATKPCYCERCRAEFLKRTGIGEPPADQQAEHWTAWADFHRDLFREHVIRYADAIHARKPACTVCSNWMYTVGHPEAVNAPVDYLSGDFQWNWSLPSAMIEARFMDGRRAGGNPISWDLMAWGFSTGEPQMAGWTFKHAPALCQEAAIVIAQGGAILYYDQPQRSGRLTRWHQEIMAEAARFARARQPWCQGTVSASEVALLHNSRHFYDRSGDALMSIWTGAQKPVAGALHALLENHCSVDILAEYDLAERIDQYKLVVIPEQTQISDALAAAIERFVRAGGRLLVVGADACSRFAELAGIAIDGDPREGFLHIGVGNEATVVRGPWQPVSLKGAETVHEVLGGKDPLFDVPLMPASTIASVGKGRVAAIPGPLFSHFVDTHYPRTRKLVGELLERLDPSFTVTSEAPARVHLVPRRQGERLIVHLINTGTGHPLSPQASLVEDVAPAGPVTLRIAVEKRPSAVYLAPSMNPLPWVFDESQIVVRVESVGIMESVIVEPSA